MRRATIREVPDAVKHDFWVGKPLFIAEVFDGGRLPFDGLECNSVEEACSWLREQYGIAAEGK